MDLYIAQTDGHMFQEILAHVDESWLDRPGQYVARQRKGKACRLSLLFHREGGRELGLTYLYGSESEGPPEEIRAFVLAAIDATQSWYEVQQRMAGGPD